MGNSSYSDDTYRARVNYRAATATPVFKHDTDIKTGKTKAATDPHMSPKGVTRESRDSVDHPITVPIGTILDTTGSMADVPRLIEAKLSKLMGHFLDDKASGKDYLGGGYPAILIGAVDDYDAQICVYPDGDGCLQVGQFESGIEIDNDLERLWLTRNGGGTYQESYELALYFFARHTVHDHFEKRHRKGYLFLIGDEKAYPSVSREQVKAVIGDTIQSNISLAEIVAEVKERYHVFFIIPNLTQHYSDPALRQHWVELLGQQNVLMLDNPDNICEMIVSAVALCEQHVGLADLISDGVATGVDAALVPLSRSTAIAHSAAGLPAISGSSGAVERL